MELRVGGKFRLGRKVGSGSFGEIYSGTNMQTNEAVAIKLEKLRTSHPQLMYESRVYRLLQGGTGVPAVHWVGVENEFNVLVMDLLGPSLEDLFQRQRPRLSLKTVLMLADQMLARVEYVHSKDLLHRDMKPDNFLMSRDDRLVYIIDFGLAKKFRDSKTRRHIPYRDGKNLTGTARYASVHTHLGAEQARRDDLEGLGYVWVYLLQGKLPWQGLPGNTKHEKYSRIKESKVSTSISDLCRGLPGEFVTYLSYVRNLGFEEEPNYVYLKNLFKDLFLRMNFQCDWAFDWVRQPEEAKREEAKGPRRVREEAKRSRDAARQPAPRATNKYQPPKIVTSPY